MVLKHQGRRLDPCMVYSLKDWTWWSLWIPSNSEYSVILTFNIWPTEQPRQSYNSSFFSHFSLNKQSGLKTSRRWLRCSSWAGKTPNTVKVYSIKHKILLQDRPMLWKEFSCLLLQNFLSFILKESCLFRLVLLTNTSQQIFYYSKASASLSPKQNSTLYLPPVITPTIWWKVLLLSNTLLDGTWIIGGQAWPIQNRNRTLILHVKCKKGLFAQKSFLSYLREQNFPHLKNCKYLLKLREIFYFPFSKSETNQHSQTRVESLPNGSIKRRPTMM